MEKITWQTAPSHNDKKCDRTLEMHPKLIAIGSQMVILCSTGSPSKLSFENEFERLVTATSRSETRREISLNTVQRQISVTQ